MWVVFQNATCHFRTFFQHKWLFSDFLFFKSSQTYFTFFQKLRFSIFKFFFSLKTAYFRRVQTLAKLKVRKSLLSIADKPIFTLTPIIHFSLALTALFLIPMINEAAIASFEGDLIFLMFILALIILTVFLAGYGSASSFSIIGGVRSALQMIGYEIPMALSLIGPALSAGTLSISGIVQWQGSRGLWTVFLQPIGFIILIVCLLAELEFVPFDIPEAETEIVAGWRTEFSGRKLALFKLGKDLELLLASALIASLYLGGAQTASIVPPIVIFLIKTVFALLLLSISRALFARFRIDQMVSGMWKYLIPLATLQVILISLGVGR